MPSLASITATFFVNLINRLGVRPPPDEGFLLSNVVQPVSIVDADIAIPAVLTTQVLGTPFSTGIQAAPGAGVLLADTGVQPAGNYSVLILVGVRNVAGGCDFVIERRNAANAANIWRQVGTLHLTNNGTYQVSFTARLELNERFRIETDTGGTNTIEANLWIVQVG